ncbi:HlyD family efflux transporter periplasmic adaptor subunit [Ekhidna sp.]
MPRENNIEVKSEEVQEILSHVPNWVVRWGTAVIFFVILTIIISSWFIKYPDIITARLELTTTSPPVHLVARATGRLELIKVDKDLVIKGEILGIIENPAKINDILVLSEFLENRKLFIYQSTLELAQLQLNTQLDLGAIQSSFLSFTSIIEEAKRHKNLAIHSNQRSDIEEKINYYKRLNSKIDNQVILLKSEIKISKEAYENDSTFFTTYRSISKAEMNRTKVTYLSNKRSLEALEASFIQNTIQVSELENQLNESLRDQLRIEDQLKSRIIEHFEQLETDVQDWKQNFLITSPIEGQISFSKFWSDNQYVEQGEEVFSVVPSSDNIIGYLSLPHKDMGKAEIGQRVNIKLDNYPYHEYGILVGEIANIASTPRDDFYQSKITLPGGLVTTYKKTLSFKQEMQGTAEVITDDKRLIERIFNQFRSILDMN